MGGDPGWRVAGLTEMHRLDSMPSMIELGSFLFGFGFSILVYFRSIRTAPVPALQKVFYFIITFIGITGMLFLSGILIAHALRERNII